MEQKIGVSGCLMAEGRVLIVRRAKSESFLPEFYELPGGKVEFSETPQDGLVREFKEETGLSVTVGKPYDVFSYLSHGQSRQTVNVSFFVSSPKIKPITLSKAHDDFYWVSKEELINYQITPEMRQLILAAFTLEKQNKN